MSNKSKGKNKNNIWQNSVATFVLKRVYNSNCFGYFWTPQWGSSQIMGERIVYNNCGMRIVDPTAVQGNRIVKDIEVRLSFFSNLIPKNSYVVVIYKYNPAYKGTPVPDINPDATEGTSQECYAYPTIPNYQNILGTCVINADSSNEHIIRYDGEVILESSDEIRISYGNIHMWGSVELNVETEQYEKELVTLSGITVLTGTAKCAVAYL